MNIFQKIKAYLDKIIFQKAFKFVQKLDINKDGYLDSNEMLEFVKIIIKKYEDYSGYKVQFKIKK